MAEREACFGPRGSKVGIWGAISGGVFIIGLGILAILDLWWPGILVLIGVMAIIGGFVAYQRGSRVGLWTAIYGGIFLIGVAILWYYGSWWPEILFLIGIIIILSGLTTYYSRR